VAPPGIAPPDGDRHFIPLSTYFAWLMDGKYRAPRVVKWFEDLLDTGPQDWKQYTIALIVFNIALFVFGFVVLCLQPYAPLNPRGLGWLEPTTIFNTVPCVRTARPRECRRSRSGPAIKSWCSRTRSFPATAT
jgi:K+-transporting ATPase A subunit